MKHKILKACSRTTLICIEIVAVIAGLLLLAGGILVWRLNTGPVDVSFAREYVEEALYDAENDYSVSVSRMVVQWPDLRGPLTLELGGVGLRKSGAPIVAIDKVNLGLASRPLFIGDIQPVSIAIERPTLNLIRTEENEILLSLDSVQRDETEEDEDPLGRIIDLLSRPVAEIDRRSPLASLQTVEITKARMVMADYLLGITWFISPLDLTFARTEGGLMVSANADLPGGRDGASRVQADLVYRRAQEAFAANIHIQDFDPHILSKKIEELDFLNDHYAILNGNIELAFDRNFHVSRAQVSVSSVNGEISIPDAYDRPFPFEELYVDAIYDEQAGLADLRNLSLRAGGVTFSLAVPAKFTETSVEAPVTLTIPDLPQENIAPLWPDALRGDGAEIWLTQKLSGGRIHDVKATFDLKAEKTNDTWGIDINNILGDFNFENVDIAYRAPLAPITAAAGTGHFEKDTLTIDLSRGAIKDMSVKSARAVITKVIEGKGTATIDVGLKGPLQSVLRYIEPEPIGMTEEKLGLKIDDVRGDADLAVNVSFPTIRDLLAEQVRVKAEGTLGEVLLPDIVKNLDLTGGPLKLKIADGAAEISGSGRLDNRPITFAWKEYVSPEGKPFASQVKADITADKELRDAFGIGLEDWIDGTFPVQVTYTEYGGGRARADVSADLTPGTLMIGPLDHAKPPGGPASATCRIDFRNGNVQEVSDLDILAGPLRIADGRFVFRTVNGDADLTQGEIPEFVLSENRFRLDMEFAPQLVKLSVRGGFLDARPFLDDKKKGEPYDGPAVIASVAVDRMQTHPSRSVDRAKVYLDMNVRGEVERFELDAVAGRGDIYLRLKPNERGIMSLRLEADDAGAALRAFDMYENVKGGKIRLYGEAATPQQRTIITGTGELTDFYIVNAPVLAQLINAISLLGIQQLLGGDGIYFSRLESKFAWHIDRRGDRYFMKDGRTSGSSLGLTFDGRIDKSTGRIDMEGTIVPVSFVNELVGGIPLIGDILTGGGGGIIAATYKVEGPVKTPNVSVNPLSVLAPGILRSILFENE